MTEREEYLLGRLETAEAIALRAEHRANQAETDRDNALRRLEAAEKKLSLAQCLVNRLPLCSDHRDKQDPDTCLVCRMEEVRSGLRVIGIISCGDKYCNAAELATRLLTHLTPEES